MKTKIMSVFLMAAIAMFAFSPMAFAQTDGNQALSVASEEAVASTSIFWSNVQLLFTADKEKKAEIALNIAGKHSLNAEDALEKGDIKKAEAEIIKTEKMADKAKDAINGIDVDGDPEKAEKALEAFENSKARFEAHRSFVDGVHSGILARLAGKMTEEQLARVEAAFSKYSEGTEKASNALNAREENLNAKADLLGIDVGGLDSAVDAADAEAQGSLGDASQAVDDGIATGQANIPINLN